MHVEVAGIVLNSRVQSIAELKTLICGLKSLHPNPSRDNQGCCVLLCVDACMYAYMCMHERGRYIPNYVTPHLVGFQDVSANSIKKN